MSAPTDKDSVLVALRFGWAFAELRGRMRIGPTSSEAPSRGPDHPLPLEDERTWAEQTIEVGRVLQALATKLDVDFDLHVLDAKYAKGAVSERFTELERHIREARNRDDAADVHAQWHQACDIAYRWDAAIQDGLAAESFAVAAGYQLGRGVAEAYWALDPTADDFRSWTFLLGAGRLTQFDRLLVQLTDYFPNGGAVAVRASLEAWSAVAEDPVIRSRLASVDALHEQLRLWHAVLVVGQTPTATVDPRRIVERARGVLPILRAFFAESVLSIASFGFAAAATVLFAIGGSVSWLAPLLATMSAVGLTSAGVSAKLKTSAQSLVTGLRSAMTADLVKQALTLPPAQEFIDVDRTRKQKREQRAALRELRSTPLAPSESPPESLPQLAE